MAPSSQESEPPRNPGRFTQYPAGHAPRYTGDGTQAHTHACAGQSPGRAQYSTSDRAHGGSRLLADVAQYDALGSAGWTFQIHHTLPRWNGIKAITGRTRCRRRRFRAQPSPLRWVICDRKNLESPACRLARDWPITHLDERLGSVGADGRDCRVFAEIGLNHYD